MIANIERAANLFVTKTVYAVVLAVVRWPSPAGRTRSCPVHLTLVSTFTIGIPGFFLALAPNRRRYVPGFLAPGAALLRARRAHHRGQRRTRGYAASPGARARRGRRGGPDDGHDRRPDRRRCGCS